tara:strand:- start:166 stop:540 length:375 start_codon:yes stop_codon:yes gene_type:complete
MALHARVQDGVVMEVIDDKGNDIATMFTSEIVSSLVSCDDTVTERMGYDGTDFGPAPSLPLDISWSNLRRERDDMLDLSDWTQANDSPLTDEVKATWATYREALRNLPANTPDPTATVTWPTKP